MTAYVYMMTSRRNGPIYTGVTSNVETRVFLHKTGEGSQFTSKYGCRKLVWFEEHGDIRSAIQREKSIKRYYRQWKISLIEDQNPEWKDLAQDWFKDLALSSSGLTRGSHVGSTGGGRSSPRGRG